MVTKLGRVVNYQEMLSYIISYEPLMTWSYEKQKSNKLKPLHLHYHKVYRQKTWQDGDLHREGSYHDVTRPWSCKIS